MIETSEIPHGNRKTRKSSTLSRDEFMKRREWMGNHMHASNQKMNKGLSSGHNLDENDSNRDFRNDQDQPRPFEQKKLLQDKRDNYACLRDLFNHLEIIVPHHMEKISRGNLIFKTISYIQTMKANIYRLFIELERLQKENAEMKERYNEGHLE